MKNQQNAANSFLKHSSVDNLKIVEHFFIVTLLNKTILNHNNLFLHVMCNKMNRIHGFGLDFFQILVSLGLRFWRVLAPLLTPDSVHFWWHFGFMDAIC